MTYLDHDDLISCDSMHVQHRLRPEGYREIVTVTRGETLHPLLLPGVAIGAAEILG